MDIYTVIALIGGVGSALGGTASFFVFIKKRFDDWEDNAEVRERRLTTLENNIEVVANQLPQMKRSLAILNHNSTTIATALVAAKIIPPEVIRALTEIDVQAL